MVRDDGLVGWRVGQPVSCPEAIPRRSQHRCSRGPLGGTGGLLKCTAGADCASVDMKEEERRAVSGQERVLGRDGGVARDEEKRICASSAKRRLKSYA